VVNVDVYLQYVYNCVINSVFFVGFLVVWVGFDRLWMILLGLVGPVKKQLKSVKRN